MHVAHDVIGIGAGRDVDPHRRLIELAIDGGDQQVEPLARRAEAERADHRMIRIARDLRARPARQRPGIGPGTSIRLDRGIEHDQSIEEIIAHESIGVVRFDLEHDGKTRERQRLDLLAA